MIFNAFNFILISYFIAQHFLITLCHQIKESVLQYVKKINTLCHQIK